MSTNPNIYNQNFGKIWSDNLPPDYNLPKFKAWGAWLLTPLQWLRDLIYGDYSNGFTGNDWVTGTNYIYGDRVRYTDNRVYELTNIAGLTPSTVAPDLDPANWFKVLDTWIGLRERAKYNSQKIMMEYILNKFFRVPISPAPQIYISRLTVNISVLWMAQDSTESTCWMAQDSLYSTCWMPQVPDQLQQYCFTVYVPAGIYAQIGALIPSGSSSTAEDVIRSIVDRYLRAGKVYNVIQY